ncbi:hypothetical protein BDV38DRAFT_249281 [Aspergillus pseudotamarii]|uniref:Uncharacterized protein n=1 Tax=Aspergillus pseudotamarii TaxID=132259 RepID=A0A5N6SS11_ASPPS|nr:uncharacterized protein BDV38DRAFT_249281 [Aspergillus pseudotamarii]KAE8136571.1 hypothetical protein BDV38DRAFT_249281 [Aspergillus pseudotamarii]
MMAYLPLRTLVGLVAVLSLSIPVLSLEVLDSSKCRGECGDRKNTLTTDLVCQDSSFNTTANGITMKNCLLCESTGTTYVNDHASDTWDFLFIQKYTLQTCLYDRASETSISGCEDHCLPLRSIFKDLWYKTNHTEELYYYCSDVFTQYAADCATCLRSKSGSVILGNFMDNMDSACETKPNASAGETITLRRPLFDLSTATSTNTATSSSSATATATGNDGGNRDATSSGLSTGAKAGIGVGVGVGGLIILGAAAWLLLARRKRGTAQGGAHQYEPPLEQGPASEVSYGAGVPVEQVVVKQPGELAAVETAKAELDDGNGGVRRGDNAVELP